MFSSSLFRPASGEELSLLLALQVTHTRSHSIYFPQTNAASHETKCWSLPRWRRVVLHSATYIHKISSLKPNFPFSLFTCGRENVPQILNCVKSIETKQCLRWCSNATQNQEQQVTLDAWIGLFSRFNGWSLNERLWTGGVSGPTLVPNNQNVLHKNKTTLCRDIILIIELNNAFCK